MLNVTKIVGRVLSSNMYCIYEERTSDCWIVDIGDFNELKKYIPNNANIRGLFITHGHFDHIADINAFHINYPESIINESDKYGCLWCDSYDDTNVLLRDEIVISGKINVGSISKEKMKKN